MKETKNIYSFPIERKNVIEVRRDSSAHKNFVSKVTKERYDLRNAVDFSCGIGAGIKSALGGVVVYAVNDVNKNYKGESEPKKEILTELEQDGNNIWIKHDNDEFSVYSHLSKVFVKKGDIIKTGELIGLSGETGWAIKPHLHFMVCRFLENPPRKDFESLKIRWISNSEFSSFADELNKTF